ncbi:MAG: ABC transporter ATP-binding protein [Planctomycetota bacterium]|nr:MAG: ABC transporter ATP-binding protein [Planctomycetota bacterium]
MSDIVIKVEDLSKVYRIGMRKKHDSFREMASDWLFSRFRRLTGKSLLDEDAKDTIWALKDVSFEMKRGEILGIIGKNGSGKSTLLKILSRITEPTKGRAEINGRVASLLEVGTGFHPELTGRENIFLNGAILGMKRAEIKANFDEIVDFSGIEKFIDTPVKRYSSGMYVRLAFAVAAHLQPEILLIDEVLAVGDVEFQKKCLGRMDSVAEEGRTILFVSHNMSAITRLCPKTIWLEEGKVNKIGDSESICEKYLFMGMGVKSGAYTFDDGAEHAVQFLRLEMLNSKDEPTSVFRADEPIKFRITYRIEKDISGLSVVTNITDALGQSLWGMSDLDLFPELYEKRLAGTWVYECIAPANVLKPRNYLLALGAGTGSQYFHHPSLCPFEISTAGYWGQAARFFSAGGGPLGVPMEAKMPVPIKED